MKRQTPPHDLCVVQHSSVLVPQNQNRIVQPSFSSQNTGSVGISGY